MDYSLFFSLFLIKYALSSSDDVTDVSLKLSSSVAFNNYTLAQLEKAIFPYSPLTLYELLGTKSFRKSHMSLSYGNELGECIEDRYIRTLQYYETTVAD